MGVSSGIAMEIHYCMGKKAGVDFYQTEKDKCGRCGMKEKKNGCCSDEHKFYKLEDSHKQVSNDISFAFTDIVVPKSFFEFNWQVPVPVSVALPLNHSPPDDTGQDICIRNCVFRL